MVERIKLIQPRNPKRVYDVGAPNVHGTIVADHNCEVVEIQWDQPDPWGFKGFHIRRYLRIVGEHPITPEEAKAFKSAHYFEVADLSKRIAKCQTFDAAKKIAGTKYSVYAVAADKSMTVILRSLWNEYNKLQENQK